MWILCNNYGKKLAYLKPPDSMKWPRVNRYDLKTLLCIFWNSSGVLHDRVSEMSLMTTPYAKYHKLTKAARNDCSHRTSGNGGPLRLEEKSFESRRQIKEKLLFYIKLLRLSPPYRIVPTRLQTMCIHFVLYNAS